MGGGVVVELQRAREALEHLFRRSVVAALLQAHVVVDAEARERRELFAAQSRHAAPVVLLETDVLRPDPLPASPEKLGQLMRTRHPRKFVPALTGRR